MANYLKISNGCLKTEDEIYFIETLAHLIKNKDLISEFINQNKNKSTSSNDIDIR